MCPDAAFEISRTEPVERLLIEGLEPATEAARRLLEGISRFDEALRYVQLVAHGERRSLSLLLETGSVGRLRSRLKKRAERFGAAPITVERDLCEVRVRVTEGRATTAAACARALERLDIPLSDTWLDGDQVVMVVPRPHGDEAVLTCFEVLESRGRGER